MVSVDEQYPYRLYMPQQDNSTVIIPSVPPVSWGFDHPAQAWQQASGCETGQIWPKPDGKVVWGACKGEVGRYNTTHRPGEALLGLPAEPLRPRPRRHQVPLPPPDRRLCLAARLAGHLPGVARAAPLDGRGHPLGRHQPRSDGERSRVPDRLGQPDHARRDRRRGLLHHLLDDRVAPREGRDLGRRQRRTGPRDARQRQDVEERHAARGWSARASRPSKTRRTRRAAPTSLPIASCASTTSSPTSTARTTTAPRGRC